jgi:hypothetical protein
MAVEGVNKAAVLYGINDLRVEQWTLPAEQPAAGHVSSALRLWMQASSQAGVHCPQNRLLCSLCFMEVASTGTQLGLGNPLLHWQVVQGCMHRLLSDSLPLLSADVSRCAACYP